MIKNKVDAEYLTNLTNTTSSLCLAHITLIYNVHNIKDQIIQCCVKCYVGKMINRIQETLHQRKFYFLRPQILMNRINSKKYTCKFLKKKVMAEKYSKYG